MSNKIKMSETEVKTSEKLIQRARDALSSISLEEIVVMLHQRFPYQWQWEAFKEHLLASAKDLISTKDQP